MSEGLENNTSKFWGIFGKVSAIIMVVGSIVTIYQQLKSKFNVDVVGSYHYYNPYPKPFEDSSSIENKDSIQTYYEFFIRNNGDNTLEDMIFESPLTGYYKIIYPDTVVTASFKRRFAIGSLRPTYQLTLFCWSYEKPSMTGFDSLRVTHKNGSIKVFLGNVPNGIPTVLILGTTVMLFVALVLIGVVVFNQEKCIKIYQQRIKSETLKVFQLHEEIKRLKSL